MTKGEYRVGISFNPSGNEVVDQIKRDAANLIDHDGAGGADAGEVARLKALAQTDIETAAMHAVKACTKRPKGE